MAKITVVKKARKAQGDCQKCGTVINVGDSYQWVQVSRFDPKRKICTECSFSRSDLTSSDKIARCYDAEDSAQEAIAGWAAEDGYEALAYILRECATNLNEVAEEYQEAADAFENGGGIADQLEEKAEEIRTWAEDIESAADDIEEFDEDGARDEYIDGLDLEDGEAPDKDDAEAAIDNARQTWFDECVAKAEDALGGCPV